MFEGKTFFPETGMPMRKIACISKLLALAEPVPFTVAILNAKSLTAAIIRSGQRAVELRWEMHSAVAAPFLRTAPTDRTAACPTRRWDNARRTSRNADRRLRLSP